MIISNYISKEILATLFATTLVLFMIFASEQMLSYLRSAASGNLSLHTIFLLLSIRTPSLLAILLPLSLFLSLLLAYGRLYVDNEITVLSSCGMSKAQLFLITLRFAIPIAMIVAMLSLWLIPKMENISAKLVSSQKESEALNMVIPNRFNSIISDKWVFYVGNATKDRKELKNIFAAEEPTQDGIQRHNKNLGVVFAKKAHKKTDSNGNPFIVLTDGHRYNGKIGGNEYQVVKFKEYGVRLNYKTLSVSSNEKTLPTKLLMQHMDIPSFFAELNWRISLPIIVLVLTLFSVPLSKVNKRQGRYVSLIPAVVFYIIYANLMFLSKSWISRGMAISGIGMMWIHVVMTLFAILLILHQGRAPKLK